MSAALLHATTMVRSQPTPTFTDAAPTSGIDHVAVCFELELPTFPIFDFPSCGCGGVGGAAWFDYDMDGELDSVGRRFIMVM